MKAKSHLAISLHGSIDKTAHRKGITARTTKRRTTIISPRETPPTKWTKAQEDQRKKYATCAEAWHTLTEEEKENYNKEAKPLNLTGFNLFMHRCMLTTSTTIYPVADTYVEELWPNDNHGDESTFWAGNSSGYESIGLIKFDLSQLPRDIVIHYAKLKVTEWAYEDAALPTSRIRLYRVLSPWNENTVTYNTKPEISDDILAEIPAQELLGEHSFEITEDIQYLYKHQSENYGHALRPSYLGTDESYRAGFESREHDNTASKLYVEYAPL